MKKKNRKSRDITSAGPVDCLNNLINKENACNIYYIFIFDEIQHKIHKTNNNGNETKAN